VKKVAAVLSVFCLFLASANAQAGFFDDIINEVVQPAKERQNSQSGPGNSPSQNKRPYINKSNLKRRHIISGIPMNGVSGLPRQTDSWSCGPHVATRIAKFYRKNHSYQDLMRTRIGIGIPTMEGLTTFDPQAHMFFGTAKNLFGNEMLVKVFRTSGEEEKMLLEKYFNRVQMLENAQFDDLKGVISQNIPVAVMITNGQREEPLLNKVMNKRVKLNNYHWVLVYGYDEDRQKIYYADSYVDGPSELPYNQFQTRWNTREAGFFLNVGVGLFLRERTMVWAQ